MEETAEVRLAICMGAVHPHRWLPKSQCTVEGGGAHLLPHWTGEHQTLMVTPLQVRPQAIAVDPGATEGVGKRSGWCPQDWICQSSSQLIQGWR